MLNQSINICYCEIDGDEATIISYDDIDSFTELIAEEISNDDNLFPEQDERQESQSKTLTYKTTHFSPISLHERHSIFIVPAEPGPFDTLPQPATSEGFPQRPDAPPDPAVLI